LNAAGVLRLRRDEVDRLNVVARRRGIRNVVAGDLNGLLKGLQRRDIDSEDF